MKKKKKKTENIIIIITIRNIYRKTKKRRRRKIIKKKWRRRRFNNNNVSGGWRRSVGRGYAHQNSLSRPPVCARTWETSLARFPEPGGFSTVFFLLLFFSPFSLFYRIFLHPPPHSPPLRPFERNTSPTARHVLLTARNSEPGKTVPLGIFIRFPSDVPYVFVSVASYGRDERRDVFISIVFDTTQFYNNIPD